MGLSLQIYGAIARILALSLLLVGGLGVLWSPSAGAQQPTSEEEVRGRIQTLRAQGRLDERLPEGLRQAVGQVSKTLGLEQQRGLATGSPRKLKKKEANLVTRAGAGLTGVSSSSTSIADVDGDQDEDLLITGIDVANFATATLYQNLSGNEAPTASDDSDQTGEGESVTTAVLANDSDPDGSLDASTVTIQSSPSDGTASANSSTGEVTYTPNSGFTGTDSYTYTVKDGDGAESNEATVTIEVNEDNQVPTASFTVDPSAPKTGQEVVFDASESEDPDGTIQSYEWDFGDGTSGSGTTTPHSYGDDGAYTVTLTVADTSGASAEATSDLTVRPSQMPASVTQSFGGDQKEDYRLVALPDQSNGALSETISGSDWRGFRETGASGDQAYSRSECSGGCQFGPGVGFWLIAGQAWQVDRTVETVTLSAGGTVQISVQDGWNAVSNPLETDVQWSAVQQATGTEQPLWRWSGSWQQAQTFRSAKEGDAYYFRDDQVGQLTVPFPGVSGNAAQATADTARSQKRALALSVLRIGEPVTTVEAGVRPGTEAGLDRHDLYGPPGYFGLATLRLMQEDPQADQARPTALAAEYRAPGGEGHSFALRLRAPADTALTLRAENIDSFGGDEVALVEEATGETHDLRKRPTVTIVPRSGTTRYRLLIGSEAYVAEKKRQIRPSAVKLLLNYPNPFSQQTTIEYAVPEPKEVRLVTYDVLGRRVATIADERREGGFHRVRWEAGRGLPSGTYFLRLRAGDRREPKSCQWCGSLAEEL